MSDRTINERLAIVETKVADDIADGKRREQKQEQILTELTEIRTSMAAVATDLARYRSWVGGAVFIFSCVGAFLYKFGEPLINLITRLKTGN